MARADGRLTADLNPQDHGPQDACGVIGIYAPGEEVSKLTYFGMYALQHRGQESAGMAVSDGRHMMVFKDMGLVSQVFDEATLNSLQGHMLSGTPGIRRPVRVSGTTPSRRSGRVKVVTG
ncbi:amidophosphoribosyltransferase [Cutibacterium acnes JCM 18920]|nr:amidophosphoribosyltransferase [Cutibacterium acnes JCM 18920]